MSIYSTSLSQLVERVCRLYLHEWKSGTITGAPTTAQIIDSSRNEADDYFQNTVPVSRARILSTTDGAAPKGEEREFTDWANATKVGTLAPVFSAAPAAGDTYAIFSEYYWDDIVAAINAAIDSVATNILVEKIDETLTAQDDTYEYTVPSGFLYIYRISQADGDGDFPNPVPPTHYTIVRGAAVPRIHFKRFPVAQQFQDHYYSDLWAAADMADGRIFRIEGLGRQETLADEEDICQIDPNFICAQAAALLHASRIRRPENEPDDHRTQFGICQGLADKFKKPTRLPQDCKRVET
jgi:hypothetical protein